MISKEIIKYFNAYSITHKYISLKYVINAYCIDKFEFGRRFTMSDLNKENLKRFKNVRTQFRNYKDLLLLNGYLKKFNTVSLELVKQIDFFSETPADKNKILEKREKLNHTKKTELDE